MVLQNILKRNTFAKNVTLLIFKEFFFGGPICKINIKPVAPFPIVCIILVIELNNQTEGK
jgi:hypothetical protein